MPIHLRSIVVLTIVCAALGTGGCRTTSDPGYEEMLLPLQTGSHIQRHIPVSAQPEKKSEKKKEEKKKTPKPEAEPSATPAPEEESTPPPSDRFR